MDNPNHSARIRRCTSRPSRLQRRATALMSRRLAWNKNPYVGSFRHAPPSTVGSIKACLERSYATQHFYFSSSPQGNMRHSPYIGWFRHSPPTHMTMHRVDPRDLAMSEKTRALAMILSNLPIRDHRPKLSQVINGRLRGGGRTRSLPAVCCPSLGPGSCIHSHRMQNLSTRLATMTESSRYLRKIQEKLKRTLTVSQSQKTNMMCAKEVTRNPWR